MLYGGDRYGAACYLLESDSSYLNYLVLGGLSRPVHESKLVGVKCFDANGNVIELINLN